MSDGATSNGGGLGPATMARAGAVGAFLAVLLLMVVPDVSARGRAEIDWETVQVDDMIAVTGQIGVYGNEPHTYLAVAIPEPETESGLRVLRIEGELEPELWELQNLEVTIHGRVTQLEIGPGLPMRLLVTQYTTGD